MRSTWFSAMLRFVHLIKPEGGTRLSRSVIVFRADGWSEARRRAQEIGHAMERSYTGGTGDDVSVRLEVVETLDLLGDAITDGREVYSEPLPLPAGVSIPFDAEFNPSGHEPGQSGI